ncbi:unnamed protein product [Symbiodinium sp. CCMP2592]|nr:unnamed protein product [Symbiodinium sp. CCMP2592]
MAMAPCAALAVGRGYEGDPIALVRDSFKHYVEAVLQHLTELQRRWHPFEAVSAGKCRSSKQVEELAALCRECGLASAKAVVACDRVLRRQIQEPKEHCVSSRLEASPQAAPDQEEAQELRQLMAKRLQRAYRRFQQRRKHSKLKAGKVLATSLVCCLGTQLQQSLNYWRSGVARKHAAGVIAKAAQGWLSRRCAHRAAKLFKALRCAENQRSFRLMRRHFALWTWKLEFSQRWQRKREEDLALTPVDVVEKQRDFWWLFPSDGKTAVAKAQFAWFKKRLAWLAWVSAMSIERKTVAASALFVVSQWYQRLRHGGR